MKKESKVSNKGKAVYIIPLFIIAALFVFLATFSAITGITIFDIFSLQKGTITTNQLTGAATAYGLLKNYEQTDYDKFKQLVIGDKIVYFKQEMVDDAIVEGRQEVYQFDKNTGNLLKKKVNTRSDLPAHLPADLISKEEAEASVEGTVKSSKLYYLSPDSDIFLIKPTPTNPCWVVNTEDSQGLIHSMVVDAVNGGFLGEGLPPPSSGFALAGPLNSVPNCSGYMEWYQMAANAFAEMGYPTDAVVWPSKAEIQAHIQDPNSPLFYEVGHGTSFEGSGGGGSFTSGCINGTQYEKTTASNIRTWLLNSTKKQFALLVSCDAMCYVSANTLSDAFRKGSFTDTTTVGFCGLGVVPSPCNDCYNQYIVPWQQALFDYMKQGYTVKSAFDSANADYPCFAVDSCSRFAGDPNFAVPLILPGVGSLSVNSTPSAASVYVDDALKGVTPLLVSNLLEGTHSVKVSKSGYYDYVNTTYISENQTTFLSVALAPYLYGNLSVSSIPTGAKFYLNNTLKGTTPLNVSNLLAGSYSYKFTKSGYKDYLGTVVVLQNQVTYLNVTMSKKSR